MTADRWLASPTSVSGFIITQPAHDPLARRCPFITRLGNNGGDGKTPAAWMEDARGPLRGLLHRVRGAVSRQRNSENSGLRVVRDPGDAEIE